MLFYLPTRGLTSPQSVSAGTLLALLSSGVAVAVGAAARRDSLAQSRIRGAGGVNDSLLDSGLPERAAAATWAAPNLFFPIS